MLRFASVAVAIFLAGARLAAGEDAVRFNRDVRPILSDTCFHCHGPDANARTTEMRLDTKEGTFGDLGGYRAVVPGDLAKSELWQRVSSDDETLKMPPPDSGRTLTPKQIETLERWIEQGATWRDHWSFIPPERPRLPEVSRPEWPRNPIDHFVLAKLDEEGLEPSAEAAKETLIRRVTLDLTGLSPTVEEVDAFLADDSPDAYERLVDRLLASPRYGEWMALPWLDAARYADSNGYQRDGTRTMWPWRDWVVRSLNENRPFDEFTVEQIAGDLLPNATPDQLVASGFNRNHMLNGEGGRIAEESRVEYVVDRVDTTSTVWLGLTLGCARCHDHKYDPFTQKEFYRFYAYFNGIDETGRVDAGGNANPVMMYPLDEQRERIAELQRRLDDLERELKERPVVDPAEVAKFEAELKERVESETANGWRALAPHEFVSQNGQTIERRDGNVLFVSGANPAKDVYTVRAKLGSGRVTALRLETLPHASFTSGGLARSNSGNFVLTGFEVAVTSTDGKSEPVKIASAVADHEQNGWPVKNAFDGNAGTGWAVLSNDIAQPRTAVFTFAEPIEAGDDAELVVTLEHESPHVSHNIGRFRLSATSAAQPTLEGAPGLPENVVAAVRTPEAERSEAQRRALLDAFHQQSERTKKLQKQIAAAKSQLENVRKSVPEVMVMRERKEPRETHVLIRGAYDQYGDPVSAGVPERLHELPRDVPNNRLGLARWLVSESNPLTARVTVNRFWQRIFGRGLVDTPEDFGVQGERPTHPELLDWLATEFVRTGWDVKRLHRAIVTSATYRQSSRVTPALAERDPENVWLARGPRHRLPAFALRDQALALSGLLVERVGGPPVYPYQPPGIWAEFSFDKIKYEQDHGEKLYRRSLYTFWRRSVGPTSMFDTSSRQVCTVRVRRTNTPLHALTTFNDPTFVEAARKFAERILTEGGSSPAERIAWGFRAATAREPSPRETEVLTSRLSQLAARYGQDPEAAEQLLSVGESPVGPSLDPTEVAAYTGIASVLLNLDEVLVKE